MRASARLRAAVNVSIILGVGFFFWGARGRLFQRAASAERRVEVDLSVDQWETLAEDGAHLGPASARAVLVEFIDYQCSFCARADTVIDRFLQRNPDKAIIIRHFPLATHSAAEGAARAAICAEAQGHFHRMHRRLLGHRDWHLDPSWHRVAEELGIPDLLAFGWCLDSPATHARIAADLLIAKELGVRASPTFFSKGGRYVGVPTGRVLRHLASAAPS
jgi:protein-disulfide isomerase